MASIRNVNLVWEMKHRGVCSPSAFALSDIGTLALSTPRPLEARAYDFTLYDAGGASDVRWGFTVETLQKMETSQSDNCVGMTSDDLYLFCNRSKSRFLSDRHINYIDASLSHDGQRLAAAFSDLAGASFAVAYGDISGRVIWLEEFEFQPTAVSISGNGMRIAIGCETGNLTLLDSARREVWVFELNSSIKALACSTDGQRIAYAADNGSIGLIGGDGVRIWESAVNGTVTHLALSGDGNVCAVLTSNPDDVMGAGVVHCLMADGGEGWQHETERRSTGVSLSSNGKYLAVGSRDGYATLYELSLSEQTDSPGAEFTDAVRAQARKQVASGELAEACKSLWTALSNSPGDVELHQEYLATKKSWHESASIKGEEAMAMGEPKTAIRVFSEMLEEDPLCSDAAASLRRARCARSQQLLEEANSAEAIGDLGVAENALRQAAAVALPDNADPRVHLAAFFGRRAATLDALAELQRSQGNDAEALSSLMTAQSLSPVATRLKTITDLQIEIEFEIGMAAYDNREYNQAVFQFKKVLRLNKNHAEANRRLEFARRFAQDRTTESLQDRFSRLE